MPREKGSDSNEHADWKAPVTGEIKAENQEGSESKSDSIKFNPDRRPGIPRGAGRKGGNTVFHHMAELWDEAKAEHDSGKQSGPAVQRYEEYSNWVNDQYGAMAKGEKGQPQPPAWARERFKKEKTAE